MEQILSLTQAALVFGTVILFGAVGEILTEKSGNLNLGVPGIMYLGGIAGLAGSFMYEMSTANPIPLVGLLIALLCTLAASLLGGLIYSFLTITLRANQNVTGLTLTIFGSGVANFFGGAMNTMAGGVGQISVAATSGAYRATLPFLDNVGVLSSLGFMVYVALILAFVMSWFLNKTRMGLNLRSVGENPATADAVGINVTKYKYMATCIGAAITGLGGLYYVMDYIKGTWANDAGIERLGWLAVALVIFARWKPKQAIWGSYLFGVLFWLYFYIGGLTRSSQELFKMLPYVVTIVVLIVVSIRRKHENQPPESLGLPYFREDR
ncbi:MAG TPA: ABC transporter permease [Candidatus Limiplasma sp.]|nr:ABC transporter permease [Candidatus Limiplasma sp.]HPS82453.1 ABC transporter permease [Candidatus Limiplasma sp.]